MLWYIEYLDGCRRYFRKKSYKTEVLAPTNEYELRLWKRVKRAWNGPDCENVVHVSTAPTTTTTTLPQSSSFDAIVHKLDNMVALMQQQNQLQRIENTLSALQQQRTLPPPLLPIEDTRQQLRPPPPPPPPPPLLSIEDKQQQQQQQQQQPPPPVEDAQPDEDDEPQTEEQVEEDEKQHPEDFVNYNENSGIPSKELVVPVGDNAVEDEKEMPKIEQPEITIVEPEPINNNISDDTQSSPLLPVAKAAGLVAGVGGLVAAGSAAMSTTSAAAAATATTSAMIAASAAPALTGTALATIAAPAATALATIAAPSTAVALVSAPAAAAAATVAATTALSIPVMVGLGLGAGTIAAAMIAVKKYPPSALLQAAYMRAVGNLAEVPPPPPPSPPSFVNPIVVVDAPQPPLPPPDEPPIEIIQNQVNEIVAQAHVPPEMIALKEEIRVLAEEKILLESVNAQMAVETKKQLEKLESQLTSVKQPTALDQSDKNVVLQSLAKYMNSVGADDQQHLKHWKEFSARMDAMSPTMTCVELLHELTNYLQSAALPAPQPLEFRAPELDFYDVVYDNGSKTAHFVCVTQYVNDNNKVRAILYRDDVQYKRYVFFDGQSMPYALELYLSYMADSEMLFWQAHPKPPVHLLDVVPILNKETTQIDVPHIKQFWDAYNVLILDDLVMVSLRVESMFASLLSKQQQQLESSAKKVFCFQIENQLYTRVDDVIYLFNNQHGWQSIKSQSPLQIPIVLHKVLFELQSLNVLEQINLLSE